MSDASTISLRICVVGTKMMFMLIFLPITLPIYIYRSYHDPGASFWDL